MLGDSVKFDPEAWRILHMAAIAEPRAPIKMDLWVYDVQRSCLPALVKDARFKSGHDRSPPC
jgi:hypothetical protein